MSRKTPERDEVIEAIRAAANALGHAPSRSEFERHSGLTEYRVLQHFPNWRAAVQAAGLQPHTANLPVQAADLLQDWARVARELRRAPTRDEYRRHGKWSAAVFEKKLGRWSGLSGAFRDFAGDSPEWEDVVGLLPAANEARAPLPAPRSASAPAPTRRPVAAGRAVYGNPLDFRGLRHEPVNEQGVVLLFGMVARELGYLVEAVRAEFPDCEAKRQVAPGRWQRVNIEFEFESRSFRDHGHSPDGCDVLVCWVHNWPEPPPDLEVIELKERLRSLPP